MSYAYAVIAKNAQGDITVGSLIGLLAGPTGLAIGAVVGLVGGSTADLNNARVGDDFIDDVAKRLTPTKFALVAEIEEDWTTPVDTRMEAIDGTVFRRALSDVNDTVDDEDTAAIKADLAQLRAEHAKSRTDRKTKLQEKINQLDTKIQARLALFWFRALERRCFRPDTGAVFTFPSSRLPGQILTANRTN